MEGSEEEMEADPETPPIGSPVEEDDILLEENIRAMVENDQIDFDAWTSLISAVENTSPNNLRRICVAYDSFLSEFPLCYGYWNKYAGHIANVRSLSGAEEIFERAVQAAEFSVDMWVSYCSFAMLAYEDPADVRRLFEKALSLVNKDYTCYLLWDKYIEFEYSQKQWSRLAQVYLSSLKFPTKKLHNYYESFRNLITVWEEENGSEKSMMMPSEVIPRSIQQGEDVGKYLSLGELFYQNSRDLDRKISCYESRIRRPYFHVKPLDASQLENWHKYLDFVEAQRDFDWTVKLYERCLIPCANYSEFWIRYMEFVDAKGGRELANHALERSSSVFLKRVPAFHLYCSTFKEKIGDAVGALAPFNQPVVESVDLDAKFIGNVNREANIQRRMSNSEAAKAVYEKALKIATTKQNMQIICELYTSFARFTLAVTGSIDAATEVFVKAIQQVPCKLLIQEVVNFVTLHGGEKQIPKLDLVVTNAIATESEVSQVLNSSDREEISKLFLEFVDLYGTIDEIRNAWDRHRKLFPHIMKSTIIWNNQIVNHSYVSMEVSKQNLSNHQVSKDSSHDGQSLTNANGIHSKEVLVEQLQENITHPKRSGEHEEVAEVMEEQPVPDGNEVHEEAKKLAPEYADVPQSPQGTSKHPKLDNSKICPEQDIGDVSRPRSPATQEDLLQTINESNIPLHATSSASKDKNPVEATSNEVPANHASDAPSVANIKENNSPLHSICDSTPPESGTRQPSQTQSQTDQQSSPAGVAYPHSQLYYVQSSEPQQWQVQSQLQYAQAYSYLSHAWAQQANQYQIDAGQVYPVGDLAWMGQNMQQQAYPYAQSQPVAVAQAQLYPQALQSNEQQLAYYQQYYQQWYYLQQQQQSQQTQNNAQADQKIESSQTINPQQNQSPISQQQRNQFPLNQMQQQQQQQQQSQQELEKKPQQNNQQQPSQQEQHQQLAQSQGQNQQQHSYFTYMQQQQQQLYLQQQQQLYMHQQQLLQQPQVQQLPQEQQQLFIQQQQQLLLQQQQQQMLQLQQQQHMQLQQLQQQQQMQQTGVTEQKASSSNTSLQGEGAKINNAEKSVSPFSTPSQVTPNR